MIQHNFFSWVMLLKSWLPGSTFLKSRLPKSIILKKSVSIFDNSETLMDNQIILKLGSDIVLPERINCFNIITVQNFELTGFSGLSMIPGFL